MSAKLQTVLLNLLVALGLRERPQLQPIPVRSDVPTARSTARRPWVFPLNAAVCRQVMPGSSTLLPAKTALDQYCVF